MSRHSALQVLLLLAAIGGLAERSAFAEQRGPYAYSRTVGVVGGGSGGGGCSCCSSGGARPAGRYGHEPCYGHGPCWETVPGQPGGPTAIPPLAGAAPEQGSSDANFGEDVLASQESGATAPDTVAMTMIGDLLSGGYQFNSLDYYYDNEPTGGALSIAGGDRRTKVSENGSPLPVDRFYFNYNHFHNALRTQDSPPPAFANRVIDLNRYTLGGEKVFFGGQASIEARVPFANGLDSSQIQTFNDGIDNVANELGNVSLIPKVLLFNNGGLAISTGVGVALPTADDARLYDRFGRQAVEVQNESVHVQPFVALLFAPTDRGFLIGYAQVDFDANGNSVNRDYQYGGGHDVLQDQTLLYLDVAAGYWAYLNPNSRYLRGIAPTVELHYTTAISEPDQVMLISNPDGCFNILNITGGVHFQLGTLSRLTVAGTAPLLTGGGHQFDAEVQVQFNRFF